MSITLPLFVVQAAVSKSVFALTQIVGSVVLLFELSPLPTVSVLRAPPPPAQVDELA